MDPERAVDLILGQFKRAWDIGTPPVNGGAIPAVEWPNVPLKKPRLADGNEPWARVVIQHTSPGPRTLGGERGTRRFTRRGIVSVQVFSPAGKRGSLTGYRLGKVALEAFEGVGLQEGGLQFCDASLREAEQDGIWYQMNVSADFEYETIK